MKLPIDNEAVHICDVPAGSSITEMQSRDPLVRKFIVAHPDQPPKIIEIGPHGATVTTIESAADMMLDVSIGDDKASEDLMLYGINISLDGERIDPSDFFVPAKR